MKTASPAVSTASRRNAGSTGEDPEGLESPLRRVGTPDLPPSPRTLAEGQLAALLRATGIPRSGVYRPGEVCRLLRISRTTLLQLCALREHPAVGHPNPRGLGSFLVGCHHRIHHEALVEWLGRNQHNERESA